MVYSVVDAKPIIITCRHSNATWSNQQIKANRKHTSVKVNNDAFGGCVLAYHQIMASFDLIQA